MNGTLLYRESWQSTPPARPLTQQHVSHPDLLLSLHGPGRLGLKKSHHDDIEGDPYYVWSGTCPGSWAVALRHRRFLVDLGGEGRVVWCTRQSGGNRLRLVVKPADGPWLISDQSSGETAGWHVAQWSPGAMSWRMLDVEAVDAVREVGTPDLNRVDAVGFADLSPGGGIEVCSRLAWIEVWGTAVERPAMVEA